MLNINIDPVLFQWGEIAIGWHGIWFALALFVAYQVFVSAGRSKGIYPDPIRELFLWMAIIGYLGARLLHVLQNWQAYMAQPAAILAVHQGGLKLYGAFISSVLVMMVYARYKKLSFWSLADALAVAAPTLEIVGRVGCLINGDIWGVPTDGSWGLVYWHPDASIPTYLRGIPTFPAPIMLQIWNAGLLILMLALHKRLARPGFLFLICLIVYSLGRFLISAWQPGAEVLFGLKQTQVVSLVTIALGFLLVPCLRLKTAPLSAHL